MDNVLPAVRTACFVIVRAVTAAARYLMTTFLPLRM